MKNTKAFTLIELLVVVLIIGILAAVALPQYNKAVLRARYTQLRTYSNAIVKAQKAYYMANGTYAEDWDELAVEINPPSKISCNVLYETGALCWLYQDDAHNKPIAIIQENYTTGNKLCCSYSATNHRAAPMCAAETRTNTWYQGCGGGDGCHCYRWQQ